MPRRSSRRSLGERSTARAFPSRTPRIHYVNDECCRILGYTREELLSLRLWAPGTGSGGNDKSQTTLEGSAESHPRRPSSRQAPTNPLSHAAFSPPTDSSTCPLEAIGKTAKSKCTQLADVHL